MELPQGGLDVGVQAPLFEATHPCGQDMRLQDIREARVLVAFLSPGCSVCAEAIRTLNTIQERESGLRVLLLGGTSKEANNAYAAEHESKLPLLTPVQPTVMNDYLIPGFPFVFVLDASRTIRAKGFASSRERVMQLLSEIDESTDQAALKQPAVHLS